MGSFEFLIQDNLDGGKWIIRLKKGIASRYWEELVYLINSVDGHRWRTI